MRAETPPSKHAHLARDRRSAPAKHARRQIQDAARCSAVQAPRPLSTWMSRAGAARGPVRRHSLHSPPGCLLLSESAPVRCSRKREEAPPPKDTRNGSAVDSRNLDANPKLQPSVSPLLGSIVPLERQFRPEAGSRCVSCPPPGYRVTSRLTTRSERRIDQSYFRPHRSPGQIPSSCNPSRSGRSTCGD